MLLALTDQEGQDLQDRAAMLQQNGIRATYHGQAAVRELEPALKLPEAGGALLVQSDSQLVSIMPAAAAAAAADDLKQCMYCMHTHRCL